MIEALGLIGLGILIGAAIVAAVVIITIIKILRDGPHW